MSLKIYQLQQPNRLGDGPGWGNTGYTPGALVGGASSMAPYTGALVVDADNHFAARQSVNCTLQFGGWNWGPRWFLPVCELETLAEAQIMLDTGVMLEFRGNVVVLYLVRDAVVIATLVSPGRLENKYFWDHLGAPA